MHVRQRDVRDRRIQGLHEGGEDHAGGHRRAITELGRGFARGHRTALPNQPVRKCGRPRAWPVSTSTSTLIPARNGGRLLSLVSMRTRMGIALDDFHPVAAGVLCRQQRKLLRTGRAHAFDPAVPLQVRIGVDGHRGRLPGAHIGELGLLRRGIDPDVIDVNQIKGGRRGGEIFSWRDRRDVGHERRRTAP